jgi:MFS family permease
VTTPSGYSPPVQAPKTFYWHYAWAIVTIIAVMQMVGASIRMAFGVFIEPLTQEFGWGQGSITFAYALSSIVTAMVSPLAGSLGDRFGARKAMILGTSMFFVGMILTGMITELWQLYLTFGVLLGVAQAIFLVPLIPAAMNWYRRHLGLGMGVLMGAWGVGPALTAPLMGFLISRYGWHDTFWITAFGSVIIMFGMIALFRDRPSDRGDLPYGALPGDPPQEKTRPDADKVKVFAKFMRNTAAYWNMSSIHFLGCVGHAVILVYIIPIAVHEGLSLVVAASLLTVMSSVSVATRLAVPVLAERIGTRTVMAVAYVAQGLPVIMLFWTHDVTMFYVFAIVFGIGYGGESGGFPILNRAYYGHAPVGAAHGFQMFGAGLGMAVGGWVGGVVFDIFGGYGWALVVSIVTSLAGAVSIMMLEPTHEPLIPDWESQTDILEGQPEPAAR